MSGCSSAGGEHCRYGPGANIIYTSGSILPPVTVVGCTKHRQHRSTQLVPGFRSTRPFDDKRRGKDRALDSVHWLGIRLAPRHRASLMNWFCSMPTSKFANAAIAHWIIYTTGLKPDAARPSEQSTKNSMYRFRAVNCDLSAMTQWTSLLAASRRRPIRDRYRVRPPRLAKREERLRGVIGGGRPANGLVWSPASRLGLHHGIDPDWPPPT